MQRTTVKSIITVFPTVTSLVRSRCSRLLISLVFHTFTLDTVNTSATVLYCTVLTVESSSLDTVVQCETLFKSSSACLPLKTKKTNHYKKAYLVDLVHIGPGCGE